MAPPRPQAPCGMRAAPPFCVYSEPPDAGGSDRCWRLRKGRRGQSPGTAQKGGQEGPRWRRRGCFRRQPFGRAAGSAIAVASAASVPLVAPGVPPTPTVCEALCWDPAFVGPVLRSRMDDGKIRAVLDGDERKREGKKGLESGGMRGVVLNGVRTDSGAHGRPLVAAVGRTGWGGGGREPGTGAGGTARVQVGGPGVDRGVGRSGQTWKRVGRQTFHALSARFVFTVAL